jgi:hypothetical protein
MHPLGTRRVALLVLATITPAALVVAYGLVWPSREFSGLPLVPDTWTRLPHQPPPAGAVAPRPIDLRARERSPREMLDELLERRRLERESWPKPDPGPGWEWDGKFWVSPPFCRG